MKRIHRSQTVLIFLLLSSFFPVSSPQATALSSRDILVVYNTSIPESKEVAGYYAEKRNVPPSNLIGVQSHASETISRSDFESMIAPEIRRAVLRKKKEDGTTPAILLVYGIPLRIGERNVEPENSMAANKITEYRDLVSELSRQLDNLTRGDPSKKNDHSVDHADPPDTKEVLDKARGSLKRATIFLNIEHREKNGLGNHSKVASILIRLGGLRPIAQGVIKTSKSDKKTSDSLRNDHLIKWVAILERQLLEIPFLGIPPKEAPKVAAVIRMLNGLMGELSFWAKQNKLYKEKMASASVDSELTMLLCEPYQTAKWLINPFLRIYDKLPGIRGTRENRVMVSRLDGPTPDLAKRLVDDAKATEEKGLQGTFYIDARGLKGKDSYSLYDQHLRNLYKILKQHSSMPVVLDNEPSLFPEKTAGNAALYVGWYSVGSYVNSFQWQRGAVGFHVASAEAQTLKQPGSNVWCKRMIEEGVAATLGPVYEPYLSSFPLPEVFFPLLMTGKFSLLEVYFQSTPFLSWRQVLIGDPLYSPFKNKPAM